VYSDAERDAVLKNKGRSQVSVTRFKGLGEMNPQTLWETTLNPKSRSMLRVTISDAKKAEAMFGALLGKEVSDRYDLIQEHAHRLEIDI
jgi:DNA gyrase subunit B